MKETIFAALILLFGVYTIASVYFGLDYRYGVIGILLSMGAEIVYDTWQRRKNK